MFLIRLIFHFIFKEKKLNSIQILKKKIESLNPEATT